jgi:hypothetical protein
MLSYLEDPSFLQLLRRWGCTTRRCSAMSSVPVEGPMASCDERRRPWWRTNDYTRGPKLPQRQAAEAARFDWERCAGRCARPCGDRKSRSGPTGTIRVGLIDSWL